MTGIPWPNPQNSLDVLYYFFTGQHLTFSSNAAGVLSIVQEAALCGELLSVVFLLIFIYYHMHAENLHHHMAEKRHEEAEHIAHGAHAAAAQNPNQARFERIMQSAASANENDRRAAIIDADTMLDALLTEKGYVGADLGEKLQSAARGPFASIEAVRDAHRTRNRIAHDGAQFSLTDRDTRQAIDGYRRAFEEFDYI